MSSVLPAGSVSDPGPLTLPGLSDSQKALGRAILAHPLEFPQEFPAWLISYLEANQPRFGITGMDGYTALTESITTAGTSRLLARTAQTSDVAITATSEATAITIVTAAAVNAATAGNVWIVFTAPAWFNNNTARTLTLVAYAKVGAGAAAAFGQIFLDTRAAATTDFAPVSGGVEYGGNDNVVFSIRGYASNNTNVTVRAGNYGTGAYVPAVIRVTRL